MRYVWPKFMPDHWQLYKYRNLVRMPPNQKNSQLKALITQLSRPLGMFCFTQFKNIWKEVFKAPLTLVQKKCCVIKAYSWLVFWFGHILTKCACLLPMVSHELWPCISHIILRAVDTNHMQNDRAYLNFHVR